MDGVWIPGNYPGILALSFAVITDSLISLVS